MTNLQSTMPNRHVFSARNPASPQQPHPTVFHQTPSVLPGEGHVHQQAPSGAGASVRSCRAPSRDDLHPARSSRERRASERSPCCAPDPCGAPTGVQASAENARRLSNVYETAVHCARKNPGFFWPLRVNARPCKTGGWRRRESNPPRNHRETEGLPTKAAQKTAHSAHGRPRWTPSWRPWSMPGRRCPKRSRPAS